MQIIAMMTARLCAPENQIGFIRVMVLPLFKAWVEVFPACAPLLIQVLPRISRNTKVRNIETAYVLL
jgi:hypothetical protein